MRFVLLKGIDERGVEFFTNYESRKARELTENPRAALAILWKPLQRQVRLEGPVELLSGEESDAYFATRSRGSQLGAWASRQSEAIPDREWLETRLREMDTSYPEVVPRPPHWGGFLLRPEGSSSGRAARTGSTTARRSPAAPTAPGTHAGSRPNRYLARVTNASEFACGPL